MRLFKDLRALRRQYRPLQSDGGTGTVLLRAEGRRGTARVEP